MALTLSKFAPYLNADPETAEQIAQIFSQVLADPDVQRILADRGISPQSLLDAPITARGIAANRIYQEEQAQGAFPDLPGASLAAGFGRGVADTLNRFGLADPIAQAATGEPFAGTEASHTGSTVNLGPLEIEPARFLGTVVSSILPYLSVARAVSPVTTGIASPLLRGSATYGGTFGLIETAAQLGRAATTGEKINPEEILSETLIGGASGLPLGTGVLGRIKQALATGTTAAATGAVLPRVEFSPTRVGSEALFAALFPTTNLPPSPFDVPLSQKEVLLKEAERLAARPQQRVRDITNSSLARLSDDDLLKAIREGSTDEAILDQLFWDRGKLSSQYARARAEALDELSILPEDYLRQTVAQGGAPGQFAADALAYKLKATRPAGAPAN